MSNNSRMPRQNSRGGFSSNNNGSNNSSSNANNFNTPRQSLNNTANNNSRAVARFNDNSNSPVRQSSQNQMARSLVAANKNNIIVKNKDGEYAPVGYTKREIHQAEKAELISVARAMNDDFEPKLRKLFNAEVQAADQAIKSGLYVGYRCPEFTWDCIRVYGEHKCFCGHLLKSHDEFNGRNYMLPCHECKCKRFAFIPSRPEDVGEFWFARRRNFDISTYRVKCKCKHSHESHDPNLFNCQERGCGCRAFQSDFLCAACDQHWEKHETFFETEKERREKGLPYGDAYRPFVEMQELKQVLYDENEMQRPLDFDPYGGGGGGAPGMNAMGFQSQPMIMGPQHQHQQMRGGSNMARNQQPPSRSNNGNSNAGGGRPPFRGQK